VDSLQIDTTGPEDDVPDRDRPRPGSSVRSFESLYRDRFEDMVRLAAMLSGSRAVAEDVVQDAFANLYLRLDRVEHPESYLRRSVVNGCTSRFRRHRREDLVDTQVDLIALDASQSEDRIDLERRLAALPPRQRAAVVLRVHLGLSEAETADALRCRPGTVGSLLHRALAALRIAEQTERQIEQPEDPDDVDG
jgi:RNA polymerase sigma factor (sigma-70 family)